VAYCDIAKSKFLDIWEDKVECSEVFKQFRHVTFSLEKEQVASEKYGLEETISVHQLPRSQDLFKSELDIGDEG